MNHHLPTLIPSPMLFGVSATLFFHPFCLVSRHVITNSLFFHIAPHTIHPSTFVFITSFVYMYSRYLDNRKHTLKSSG